MKTKGEASQTALKAILAYENQSRAFEKEAKDAAQSRENLKQEFIQTLDRLTEQLLPDPSIEQVEQLSHALQLPELGQKLERLCAERSRLQARLEAFGSNPDFTNREMHLAPGAGGVHQALREAEESLARFDDADFQWALARDADRPQSALQSFLKSVTFSDLKLSRAKDKVIKKFGSDSWDSLVQQFQASQREVTRLENLAAGASHKRSQVEGVIKEHDELAARIHNFDEELAKTLRAALRDSLANADFLALRKTFPSHKKRLVHMHSLAARGRYLGQLERYLQKERADRMKRLNSISRVRLLWERRPWEPLDSDKTKWLISLPEMKQQSTEKRVRWTRRMRECFDDFDDYDTYDYYYDCFDDREDELLPYDVFGYCYSESMPYEGFSATVITDIATHREAHSLEKADYSEFRGLDKDRGVESTEPESDEEEFEEASLEAGLIAVTSASEMEFADAS